MSLLLYTHPTAHELAEAYKVIPWKQLWNMALKEGPHGIK